MCGPSCYHNHRLYTVEWRESSSDRLCMYQVTEQGLTLLDTVDLGVDTCTSPLVDGNTQRVYIPVIDPYGVSVVSWDDTRLTKQSTLECVGECWSVGVISPHTLCACDETSNRVSVVNVTDNTVTATLSKPAEVIDETPHRIAVAGNAILVLYGIKLVVYKDGISSPGTMVTPPAGLNPVNCISSDGVSRFLVSNLKSKAVFILDMSGELCEKINIDTDDVVWDCTMGDGKLWVGYYTGEVNVMSPQ